MLTRFFGMLDVDCNMKSLVVAYGVTMAVAAGLSYLITDMMLQPGTINSETSMYNVWVVVAGGLSAGTALHLGRAWFGGRGVLGCARLVLGMVMVTIVAAVIAGTLIAPLFGGLAAPVVLLTTFVAMPWLAVSWFVLMMGVHVLIGVWRDGLAGAFGNGIESQLSATSQAILYRRS